MSITSTSGTHMYDEIDSDILPDVRDNSSGLQRVSVLTIDNTYSCLPSPTSPTGQYANTSTCTYSNDITSAFNVGESITDNATQETSFSGSGSKVSVPRHMSVDSVGYLMPGTSEERSRKKRYVKN